MNTTYWLDKMLSSVGLVRASRLVDAERRLSGADRLLRRLAGYCKKYIGDLPFTEERETDNSEAIQYCLDIAAALDTPVALPLGRFTITTPITVPEGCVLAGNDARHCFVMTEEMDHLKVSHD
jgi:hypothetical protein